LFTLQTYIFAHTQIWSLVISILYLKVYGGISPYRCSFESSDLDVIVKIIHYK